MFEGLFDEKQGRNQTREGRNRLGCLIWAFLGSFRFFDHRDLQSTAVATVEPCRILGKPSFLVEG